MSLFRRKPADPAPVVEQVETEWVNLPCGYRMGFDLGDWFMPGHFQLEGEWSLESDRRAQVYRDVDRHYSSCSVCYPTVSHPDFDMEWTV